MSVPSRAGLPVAIRTAGFRPTYVVVVSIAVVRSRRGFVWTRHRTGYIPGPGKCGWLHRGNSCFIRFAGRRVAGPPYCRARPAPRSTYNRSDMNIMRFKRPALLAVVATMIGAFTLPSAHAIRPVDEAVASGKQAGDPAAKTGADHGSRLLRPFVGDELDVQPSQGASGRLMGLVSSLRELL